MEFLDGCHYSEEEARKIADTQFDLGEESKKLFIAVLTTPAHNMPQRMRHYRDLDSITQFIASQLITEDHQTASCNMQYVLSNLGRVNNFVITLES